MKSDNVTAPEFRMVVLVGLVGVFFSAQVIVIAKMVYKDRPATIVSSVLFLIMLFFFNYGLKMIRKQLKF